MAVACRYISFNKNIFCVPGANFSEMAVSVYSCMKRTALID